MRVAVNIKKHKQIRMCIATIYMFREIGDLLT